MNQLKNLIKKINNSPFLFCFLVNILFLVSYLIFGNIKYEVSDDFIMQMFVSGGYTGVPCAEITFMNIIIGYFLSFLYSLTSIINWYFWFQIIVNFVSLNVITYMILKKYNTYLMKTVIFVFLCFFSNDIFLLMQFTKTATLAIVAGSVVLIDYIFDSVNKKEIIIGLMTLLMGLLIRYRSLFICLPYLGLLWFLLFIKNKNNYQVLLKKSILTLIIVCINITFVRGSAYLYRYFHPAYNEYVEYHNYRSTILDYSYVEYEDCKEEFEKIGLTKTDYVNLMNWDFIDTEIYNKSMMKEVSAIVKEYRNNNPIGIKKVLKTFLEKKYWFYVSVLGALAIVFLGALKNRKLFLFAALFTLLTFIIIYLYIYIGRLIYRIEYSSFLSMSVVLMYMINVLPNQCVPIKKLCITLNIMLVVLRIPIYMNDTKNSHAILYHSYYNSLKKYNASFNDKNIQYELINEFKNHPNNIYFLSFQTMIQSYYLNFLPIYSIEPGYFSNTIYASGVDTLHSTWKSILQSYNIDNPAEALLEDNVYYVDNKHSDDILKLLNEKNGKQVIKTLYKSVNGFKIWKFKYK